MPQVRAETARAAAKPFAEAPAWRSIGAGWRPLFGSYRDLGFSLEWHDFEPGEDLDWSASFHPRSLEVCLNIEGSGRIENEQSVFEITGRTASFYFQGTPELRAIRKAGERHRFITVEFSPRFLRESFAEQSAMLNESVGRVLSQETSASFVQPPERLGTALLQIVESLRQPPVFTSAQAIWFRCKALELATHLFFRPPDGELFCTRAQRAARERVERAQAILRQKLAEPPTLEELAKQVGCSSFYLSRQFSQETGATIQQFIRQVRMERAAELLRTGRCNVTEAALEVGYNSLSHFSAVFHETYGCCPGLFPLKTPAQKA
jgi:AraC family transcriptional regulator